jgi:hypothetical protein
LYGGPKACEKGTPTEDAWACAATPATSRLAAHNIPIERLIAYFMTPLLGALRTFPLLIFRKSGVAEIADEFAVSLGQRNSAARSATTTLEAGE